MMRDPQPDLTAYAGRWVALFGDQIAGVGHSAEAAAQMARHSRPKERFTLRFVDDPAEAPLPLSPLLERIRPLLIAQNQPVYLVGGAVRDALLGRVSHDLDFVVPEKAVKLAFQVADALGVPAFVLDKERDTGRVLLADENTSLDFARFRGGDLLADLRDRDLTINAIVLPASASTAAGLIDPHNGQADLAARLIRPIHERSLLDDPVRTLRAVRLGRSLGFALDPKTETAVRAAAPFLGNVSAERIRDELLRLLQTTDPHQALTDLANLGLLAEVLPEIASLAAVGQSPPHHEPVLAHTISVLRWLGLLEQSLLSELQGGQQKNEADKAHPEFTAVKQRLGPLTEQLNRHWQHTVDGGIDGRTLLRLGAVFHDVGKPQTQTVEPDGRIRFLGHEKIGAGVTGAVLTRLCLSNQATVYVKKIVAGHMRPLNLASSGQNLSRRAVYRYFRDTAASGVDIAVLSLADHLAMHNGPGPQAEWLNLLAVVKELCHHYFNHYDETILPPPLLDGRALMAALSLEAGPEVGRLLALIQEAQAAGELQTVEAAVKFARKNQKLSDEETKNKDR